MPMTEALWLPMEIAPRDRRIDLRAEKWSPALDDYRVEIFSGCKWCLGGSVRQPVPYWRRLPGGWTPTHWREVAP